MANQPQKPSNSSSKEGCSSSKTNYEYTDGTKDAQRFLEATTDTAADLAEGLAKVFITYKKKHHESAEKEKDGAVRHFFENVSEGLSDGLGAAANAPKSFAKAVGTNRLARLVTPYPFSVLLRR